MFKSFLVCYFGGWVGRINSNKEGIGWTPFPQGVRIESIPGEELI
jgi:hypothetical protein